MTSTTTANNPWAIDERNFPASGTAAEKLQFLVNYAVLAPSGHNTQPWRFAITSQPEELELYADTSRELLALDRRHRELILSCGAALFNLRVAIRHFGYEASVELFPDAFNPLLLARVRLGGLATEPPEQRLFTAIQKRHTNRRLFDDKPISEPLLEELRQAAEFEGAGLQVVRSAELRSWLADLVAECDRIQGDDKQVRREIASWLRTNRSAQPDGIPGYSLGLDTVSSLLFPFVVRTFDTGELRGQRDRDLILHSAVVCMLWTRMDTPEEWLRAGQALSRLLLLAYSEDVQASFFTQPIELPPLREILARTLDVRGFPQMLFRLGYAAPARPTPRRPVDQVTETRAPRPKKDR